MNFWGGMWYHKTMKDIKCFLLDMDGTVHLSGQVFDGAAAAIKRMRAQGRVFFITNSTWFSREEQAIKLQKMGIPATADDVYNAGKATADFLAESFFGKKVFVLGTEALKEEIEKNGLSICRGDLQSPEDVGIAVVSFDPELDFKKLTVVCDLIRAGVPYVVTHPDFNYPIAGGYLPDAGGNLALVRACTGVEPIAVCGKPHKPLAKGVARLVGCKPHEVAMFGDRLMTDIRFANDNGFRAVLVLTGEATKADLEKSDVVADVILDSLADWDS